MEKTIRAALCESCGARWLTAQDNCRSCGSPLTTAPTPPEHQGKDGVLLISPSTAKLADDFAETMKTQNHPMGIFEDYEGCDSGIDTTP
jgi:predicted amidophosphoribosyltransferase